MYRGISRSYNALLKARAFRNISNSSLVILKNKVIVFLKLIYSYTKEG